MMAWMGSSIYCLPLHVLSLKKNRRIPLFTGNFFPDLQYLSVLRTEKGKKLKEIYIWDEWTIARFPVLYTLGSILGFYVSAFYAHCMCRRLSCKDRIMWDRWLACGQLIKRFLLNVRLYEKSPPSVHFPYLTSSHTFTYKQLKKPQKTTKQPNKIHTICIHMSKIIP